jgi:Protein of unknown function (DUF3761)
MQNVSLFRLSLPLIVSMSLLAAGPVQAQDTASAMVTCKDGSSSKGGQGACSHHGGVNKSADATGTAAVNTSTPATAGKAAATAAAPTASNTAPASSNTMTKSTSSPAGDTSTPAAAGKSGATASAAGTTGKSGTPTAKCKDGTLSYSAHHSGSCSSHGGVAQFLDK